MFGRKKKRPLSDFDEEIRSHIEFEIEELMKDGLDEKEARNAAIRKFGNVTIVRERFYKAGRWLCMDSIDVMQACRRAFSWKQISTVMIIAVGLTFTTAMFAVGYGYSAFSIPFKDAGRLVTVGFPITVMGQVGYNSDGSPMRGGMPAALFFELKERKDVFTDLAAYTPHMWERYGMKRGNSNWQVMAPKQNAFFAGNDVSDNYFDLLGVSFPGLHEWKLSAGTTYPIPLIVTYKTGMEAFGDDAVGKEFDTDSGKITLFGILPEGFLLFRENIANLGHGFSPLILNKADTDDVDVVARLAPGITPQLAEQMLLGISRQFAPVSDDPTASRIIVRPFQEDLLKPSRRIVLGAWLMGGLILILCISNVAGIYLMRCNYQLREFALKTAFGAKFLNLIAPIFFELIVLSGIAAVIAAMMVQSILAVIKSMVPVTNMAFGKPASGLIVFIFLLACMIVMIAVSLMPAFIAVLKNYRRGFNGSHLTLFRSNKVTRMLLIGSQAAIAMLLLAISNMAVRSYLDLFNKDIGINDSSVLVTTATYSRKIPIAQVGTIINETLEALRGGNPDARVAVYQGILFNNADLASFLPIRFNSIIRRTSIGIRFISPGFVRTVNGRILAGREFNAKDRPNEVALINTTLAGEVGWSPQEAVGQVFQRGDYAMTVIGVMGDFLNKSWEDENVEPAVYMLINPEGEPGRYNINYIVHPDVLRRTGNIERIIHKSAPETIITRHTATWDRLLNSTASGKILASFIVVIFTVAAIVIVVTGIVNTLLFTITRRTREIAIHLAMGATYGRVFLIVINDVVKAGIIGLLFGGLASWWVGKASVHFFYNGLQYQGLPGLMLMAVLMLLIIITSSLIPALCILRIEISRALAAE